MSVSINELFALTLIVRMARESLAEMTRQNEDVWEIVESMNQQPTQHECNDSNCTHNRSEPEASDTAKSFGGA